MASTEMQSDKPERKQPDKLRILRSTDVRHGFPQYFVHQAKLEEKSSASATHAGPYAMSPDASRKYSQHLLVIRGQDTRVVGRTDPEYGTTGNVYVQDAFDRDGKLRIASDASILNQPGQCQDVQLRVSACCPFLPLHSWLAFQRDEKLWLAVDATKSFHPGWFTDLYLCESALVALLALKLCKILAGV